VPQLLIRDVDSAIIDKLKIRAHNNHRSLAAEVRLVLVQSVAPKIDLQAQIAALRAQFAGRTFSDSAVDIAEDRLR
jgi:plasmid stability protein